MREHYLRLFTYENWAMQKIISILQECQDSEAVQIFQHILLARELWHNRVANQNKPFIFDGKSLGECVGSYEKNQADWIKFIESVDDFEAVVKYKTTEDTDKSTRLKDILTHVVNHSTYHRGQIIYALKGKTKLASTDFIFFAIDQ